VQLSHQLKTFDIKDLEKISGFVIAPFESAGTQQIYVLQPDLVFNGWPDLQIIKNLPDFRSPGQTVPENVFWDRQTYLKKAEQLIEDLKTGKLKKVVLSRVIEKELRKDFDPGTSFELLNERYAHSFNYVFNIPGFGSWLGATPEMFLKKEDDFVETMSLAGTKPAGDIYWLPKETEEQAIVTEFIRQQLKELQITDYKTEGPETLMAGNVGHLATKFRIPAGGVKGRLGELAACLHPTPAVCGMPKDKAYQYILHTEDHRRKFYSGFLGPWNLEGSSALFVNLRCAEFSPKILHLYVGGGLTASSSALSEWEETEHKSKTLLSVLENF
jgi:isochorismate synthase